MTSNPPTDESEPRWQQPSYTPDADPQYTQPVTGNVIVPGRSAHVPPPSGFETVIGTLAKLVWPVAIMAIIFTHLTFWPVLIAAIVLGTVLSALKNNLRQRRRAIAQQPPSPPADGSDFR